MDLPRAMLLGLLVLVGQQPAHAQGRKPEYQLKAQYLGHIANLSDRRDGQPIPSEGEPYRIGVVGKNPFDQFLALTFAGGATLRKGKAKVKVTYPRTPEEAQACNMLFISRSEGDRLEEVLGWVRNRPVVTVGDTRGFGQRGVMVNFFLEQDRVAWEVNLGALRRAGLVLDPGFLDLASVRLEGGDR